ncbi:DUF1684 domain-containing protein [Flavobacterium covae]|uniref:DUF1684 domain-containing protein n=2 Tax=Flavobacterium covae TaxID=2906076 RepID=UPI000745D4EC|nr:DUF1684 domain-containing protein [Flavobacterium covae]AMA48631.1 hypothetical protein AWN65_03710 [Flavobacterium covae]
MKDGKIFKMTTTTEHKVRYKRYGLLDFKIKNVKKESSVYQKLKNKKDLKNYFFISFKDKTNGITTYANRKHLEICIPKNSSILVNSNQSPPYSTYNEKYSCSLVLYKNTLSISIPTGVKKFHD